MNYIDKTKPELAALIEQLEKELRSRKSPPAQNRQWHILRTLIDHMPDLIYAKDTQSRFVLSNRANFTDAGFASEEEILGKTDFDFFPEPLARVYFDDEQEVIRSGQPVINKEEQHRGAEGATLWMSTTKVPLFDNAGTAIGVVGISRDITDRKRYEQALMHEQALLMALLDNIPDSIYFKNVESRYVRVSRGWARRRHLADPRDAVGKNDFDFFPAGLAQRFFDDEKRIIASGQPLISDVQKITLPGQPQRWISITKVPIADSQGKVIGTCGISHDITAVVEAEEKFAYERDLLGTLMEHIPDSIYFKDEQSRFIRVNKAWANRRRLTETADIIGKTDFDFFPDQIARMTWEDEQRIMHTGRPMVGKIEKQTIPGGEARWISVTKVPITDRDGKIIGTCGLSHDITALKAVEEQLAHEQDLLLTLMDNSPDMIYFKDRESRFTRVNRAMANRFGLDDPGRAIGKTDFDFFRTEHAVEAFEDERRIMATGAPVVGKVEHEIGIDGTDRWALTSKAPFRDRDGRIIGTFGTSSDITPIKKIERELHEANTTLEQRVETRTIELRSSNERLEERIAQLDFLTTTSYELAQLIRIEELLPVVLHAFVSRFPGACASVCLPADGGFRCDCATGALNSRSGKQVSERALAIFATRIMQRPYLVESWKHDDYLSQFGWPVPADHPCYIAIPLLADNRLIAIVQLLAGADAFARYTREEKVIAALSAQAGVSIINAQNYLDIGNKARLEGELDAARTIQMRFTPQENPAIPRMALKGLYEPAHEVGGDYLDYFQAAGGNWVVVIADVCGNGIPAALVMTVLRHSFRFEARQQTSAKGLLCAVNESMKSNIDEYSFITASCLVINPEGTAMSYARAGHPKLLKVSGADNSVGAIETEGLALGLLQDPAHYERLLEEKTIELTAGDRYLLYTDGLSEAWNENKECFGQERLAESFRRADGRSPQGSIDSILNDIRAYTGGKPLHDDLTILAMHVTG